MTYYKNLPVYKKAIEQTVYVKNAVKGFSRYHNTAQRLKYFLAFSSLK